MVKPPQAQYAPHPSNPHPTLQLHHILHLVWSSGMLVALTTLTFNGGDWR